LSHASNIRGRTSRIPIPGECHSGFVQTLAHDIMPQLLSTPQIGTSGAATIVHGALRGLYDIPNGDVQQQGRARALDQPCSSRAGVIASGLPSLCCLDLQPPLDRVARASALCCPGVKAGRGNSIGAGRRPAARTIRCRSTTRIQAAGPGPVRMVTSPGPPSVIWW